MAGNLIISSKLTAVYMLILVAILTYLSISSPTYGGCRSRMCGDGGRGGGRGARDGHGIAVVREGGGGVRANGRGSSGYYRHGDGPYQHGNGILLL